MKNGYFVIDADGHVHEDSDRGEKLRSYLDPRFRTLPLGGGGNFVDRSQGGKYGKRHGNPSIQIEDMDAEGVDVAVLYSTILLGAWGLKEREYAVALHRAYNDWLADFCNYKPERLKGVAAIPMVAPEEAALELERAVTQLGHIAAFAHTYVHNHQVSDSCYDELYACAQQYDVPIAFHASGSEISRTDRFDTFLAEHTLGHTFEQMIATVQIVYGGVLEKFPRLRVGFLEGMAGWVPMLGERMDEEYERRPFEAPLLTKKPSEYLKSGRVFFGVESEEGTLPAVINYLGTDELLMYSSDYPHWDGGFPNTTHELVERTDLTDENKRNILGANARQFYTALARVPAPA
jgi:predicted TIM-barrel fold metal-dependent hydrolase